ncbi:MAG: amidohydrolase family protein [Vicinamibacterales bacterium]
MSPYLYRCNAGHLHAAEAPVRVGGQKGGRTRHYTIDMHCHMLTPAAEALTAERPEKKNDFAMMQKSMTPDTVEYTLKNMLPAAFPKLTKLDERLRDMDEMGVDLQVVSPGPNQYYYWADPDLARELCKTINEHIAEQCARHPDRLLGMGSVALQHPDLCVEQLEYAVKKLGLKGVEISSLVGGLEIADEKFERFWAKCEELGCVVFLHPLGTTLGERVKKFYLSNHLGQPLEHTVAISHLIFGGVLDRYPGVKLFAGHGGGYLASYIGRADHAWNARPDARTCKKPPSEYLKQMWYDTIVYRPEGLRHLAAEAGVDRMVVGTDYPYDMAHYAMHDLINDVAEFSDADRAAILGGNAAKLLGIEIPRRA